MKKIFVTILFFSLLGISRSVAQDDYLYIFDSINKREYRTLLNHTKFNVVTNRRDRFRDKVREVDSTGIYFEHAGFYPYAGIESLRFKPYITYSRIIYPVVVIAAYNGALLTALYLAHRNRGNDRTTAIAIGGTLPIWGILIPLLPRLAIPGVSLDPLDARFSMNKQ